MKDQPLRRQNQVMARAHTQAGGFEKAHRRHQTHTCGILVAQGHSPHDPPGGEGSPRATHIARQFGIGVPRGGLLKF